jgi:cytochrome b6-f complex iron-sulfur subunit
MERRDFLKNAKSLIALGGIASLIDACSKTEVNPKPAANFTVDLSSPANSPLKNVGGFIITNGIFILCTGQSTYIALSQICTHAGCTVDFNSSSKQFVCPCHGGTYNINGKVISGPPPAPLGQYQVTVSGTTLTIAG